MKYLIIGVGILVAAWLLLAGNEPSYAEYRRADIEIQRLETNAALHAQWAPFRAVVVNIAFALVVLGGTGGLVLAGGALVLRLYLPSARAASPVLMVQQPDTRAFDPPGDLVLYDE